MAQKYQNFQNHDYTNTATVVNELISAINKYKEFELYMAGGDEDRARQKLIDAGTEAYQAMEHAYKNVIYRHYEKKYQTEKDFRWSEWNRETAFASEGRFDTHTDLKEKFLKIEKNPKANLDLIQNGADKSNNGPKHDAKIPDPLELKKQLIEMVRFFRAYLDPDADYPKLADSYAGDHHAWQEFYEQVGGFDTSYQYMLISPADLDRSYDLQALFHVNWDLVLDFDTRSDEDGIQAAYIQKTEISPPSRVMSYEKRWEKFQPAAYPHWIRANGYADIAGTVTESFRQWTRLYGSNFKDVMRRFREEYPKYLKIVVLPGVETKYLSSLFEAIDSIFFDEEKDCVYGVDILLLENGKVNQHDYEYVTQTALTLECFLAELQNNTVSNFSLDDIKTLPGVQDANGLSRDFCAKLESFCQPVYLDIEKTEPEGNVEEFYRAHRPISWRELALNMDLERSIYTTGEYGKLEALLQNRPRLRYDIDYKPGYGGSTMLRRIAWDFHKRYPTLLLQHYNEENIHCLRQLGEKTKLPFLVLVDSNILTETEAEEVRRDLRRENINHVVLFMNRRRRIDEASPASTLFKIPELDYGRGEVHRMVQKLLPHVTSDNCRDRILEFQESRTAAAERSPFFFALSAFDKEFEGIPQYVHNYLKDLSDQMKEFLVFIALADYINQSLDLQFFAAYLRNDRAENFLKQQLAFQSLVTFFDNKGQRLCKIKHASFTTEILRQVTSGYSSDGSNDINFAKLEPYILNFIEYSRPNPRIVNNNLTNFLQEMLITRRADADVLKPMFSKLISKVGGYSENLGKWDQNGQLIAGKIFQKLTSVYPDDPHFNAHRGRFICFVDGDYDEAIKILDSALEYREEEQTIRGKDAYQNKDPLLLHMKGMVYVARLKRKRIKDIKEDFAKTRNKDIDPELMELLLRDFESAQKIFAQVRKMRRYQLAGYISDIQMCIEIIDLKKSIEGIDAAQFWENHPADWYMELSDHANALYEACLEYKDDADDKDKEKLEEIKGAVENLRKGIDESIKWYQDYLETAPKNKRPYLRRHLAQACMQRNEKINSQEDWQYIADLMEANMREEPAKESNIRTWFNAVLHLRPEDPDDMLRTALIRLNEWIAISDDNVHAHFYRYMLTFIQAVEGMSSAEALLEKYLRKIRIMTADMEKHTMIRYWLGNSGRGMERLIPASEFPQGEWEQAIPLLEILTGRVIDYRSEENAHIQSYSSEVFFKPYSTAGEITRQSVGTKVSFGVGFSYDGPRAYNKSVKPYTGQNANRIQMEKKELKRGTWVKCNVYNNTNQYYINVEIVGFPGENGSIHVDELLEPYSTDNRPEVGGRSLDAMVLRQKAIRNGTRMVWELTMRGDEEEQRPRYKNNRQDWRNSWQEPEASVDEELIQKYAPKEEQNNPLQGNAKLQALLNQLNENGSKK